MSPSEVFVGCSVLAFTAVIVWWMRNVSTPTRWLGRLFTARAESVAEEFDTQPRTSDRDEWDSHTADAVLLTHEADDDDEFEDAAAADFLAWASECANLRRLADKLGGAK